MDIFEDYFEHHYKKIPAIVDGKLIKSLRNFENKQPYCTILYIFVFQYSFIDCILSKIVGFDQLWIAFQQKLTTANRKLVFFKMPNTFCRFTVQNCCYFYRDYISSRKHIEILQLGENSNFHSKRAH